MGLIDDASLAWTAALQASKPGTAYSLKPTDASGDFAFTRADDPNDGGLDLAATFINSDGYIERGYENHLLHSNNFDTSPWVRSASPTTGQTGYDGTNDAWIITKTSAYGRIEQSISKSGVQTLSIYVKLVDPLEADGITLRADSTAGTVTGNFNLNTQTFGASNAIDSNLEQIGNDGWYKCSITYDRLISIVRFYIALGGQTHLTTGSLYIQDAMLNEGTVAMPYIESGASKAQKGLAQDEPRFDHKDGTPSLLLEPERRNFFTETEALRQSNTIPYYNQIVSPDGYKNAALFVENTSTTTHGILLSNWFAQSNTAKDYTISIFAKFKERKFLQLQFYVDGTSYTSQMFFLETGDFTDDGAHKMDDYGNGWWRCSYTQSLANTTGGYHFARVNMGITPVSSYYAGDGISGMYLWGAQLEQGSYATSLIPTYGTSKTRFSDDMDLNPSTAWDTTGSWTAFVEMGRIQSGFNYDDIISYSGTNSLRVRERPNSGLIQVMLNNIGPLGGVVVPIGDSVKIVIKNDGNVMKWFANGEEKQFADNTILLNNITSFNINRNHKKYKEIYWSTALSDEECISLTTP